MVLIFIVHLDALSLCKFQKIIGVQCITVFILFRCEDDYMISMMKLEDSTHTLHGDHELSN
jgi:hypothetical protein